MIRSAVIAAAGIGTRLLPSTKEQPKEMLSIINKGQIKPILNLIIEQIHGAGIKKVFVITGRGKRAIEDHFTQDYSILERVKDKDVIRNIESFYKILDETAISYINQPRPDGFGAAAYLAKEHVSNEDSFYMTSGDSIVYSLNESGPSNFIERMHETHESTGADVTLAVFETDTPEIYGIAMGDENDDGIINVKNIIEKPKNPISNLAVCGKYMFKPSVFHALEKIEPGVGGEKQITDAIEWMIENGFKVVAIKLKPDEVYMDIGNPKTYVEALITTMLLDDKLGKFAKEKMDLLQSFNRKSEKL